MQFRIGGRKIGDGQKTFIIAELSANHARDFDLAVRMIKAAKKMGADAVKLQAYTPDTMTIKTANKYFIVKHPKWGGQTLYQLYKKAYTPWKWFKKLKEVADDLDLIFFATAFDKLSVDFLEGLDVPVHKVASFELNDLPLIEYIGKTKKPLIMSTGMATLQEIKEAVETAKIAGAREIILLRCVSSYPAKPKDMNLRTIEDMKRRFQCTIGLSDHTLGTGVAITAVSMGAQVIEKHFTLSRKLKSPDSFFSIEPNELKNLVNGVRDAEEAIGRVSYELTGEAKHNRIYRRSLFVVSDIKKGEYFTEKNIRSIRPAFGLAPKYLNLFLGNRAIKDLKCGTPLKLDLKMKDNE